MQMDWSLSLYFFFFINLTALLFRRGIKKSQVLLYIVTKSEKKKAQIYNY